MRYYGKYIVVESYEDWVANWNSDWGYLDHYTVHGMDSEEAQAQTYPLIFKKIVGWDCAYDSLYLKNIEEVKDDFLNSVEQATKIKEMNLAKDKQILERFK